MKSAEGFLASDHHLSLAINHCNFGTFPEGLASHDINPANRLYLIPPDSDITKSYIGRRGCPSDRIPLMPGRIYFIPGSYDLEYCFDRKLRIVAIRSKADGEGLAPSLMDELGTEETRAGIISRQSLRIWGSGTNTTSPVSSSARPYCRRGSTGDVTEAEPLRRGIIPR